MESIFLSKLPKVGQSFLPLVSIREAVSTMGRTNRTTTPKVRTEAETPNNFSPSRFSQICPDFPFLQNANLYSVSRFIVQICVADEKI